MKKSALIIISILFLGISSNFAQEVQVNCNISLNGNIKPDTIYIGLYPTYQNINQSRPIPQYFYSITDPNYSFTIFPGIYKIAFFAYGQHKCSTVSFIPPNVSTVNLDVTFETNVIGYGGNKVDMSVIKEVDFHIVDQRTRNNKKVSLEKQGDIWKLVEIPTTLKRGDRYRFRVNGQLTDDILNPVVVPNKYWRIVHSIYTGNDIIFKPALYNHSERRSKVIVHGIESDENFKEFITEINDIEKEFNEKARKVYRSSKPKLSHLIDSISYIYYEFEKKYDSQFSQIIIEKQLKLSGIRPMTLNFPKGNKNDAGFKEIQKTFLLSDEIGEYFINNMNLIKSLDPNSYLLSGDFTSTVLMMQSFLDECPELSEKYNISEKYFDEFLADFIKNSPNEKLCCKTLYNQARMVARTDEKKAIALVEQIKNNYPYEKYIEKNELEKFLARFNIGVGKIAPDFSVALLSGKKISLKDFSGKFVFIDFWGSWCAPCRQEIPHIKDLYSSVSRDQLEIIGLAQDDETKLRNYIQEQNIKYPNALAPKELLAKFGISKYPTSFLINPKGKIVRMDVRGADAMELISEEIEDYFN